MVHALIGKPAPSFSAPDSNGETYTFTPGSEGVPVALFFYPKTGSYGCTKQVCQLRDALADKEVFKRTNVKIVGVSPDSVDKQKAFVEKHKVLYPIISDESGEARKAYSVGKHIFGPSTRTTFVIDRKGVVRAVLDATMNFSAHEKFVDKELNKLDAEEKKDEAPAVEEAAGEPAPAPVITTAEQPDVVPAPM